MHLADLPAGWFTGAVINSGSRGKFMSYIVADGQVISHEGDVVLMVVCVMPHSQEPPLQLPAGTVGQLGIRKSTRGKAKPPQLPVGAVGQLGLR